MITLLYQIDPMATSDDTAEKGSDDTPAENQNDEDSG
jgi:hypothetical protein